mmetsp:Transcript_10451/g.17939  ORF Transcript_10451/g.17939 Transcript_10451/m.17939 type:complete len:132 (+) Transcript_10451:105-500(+)
MTFQSGYSRLHHAARNCASRIRPASSCSRSQSSHKAGNQQNATGFVERGRRNAQSSKSAAPQSRFSASSFATSNRNTYSVMESRYVATMAAGVRVTASAGVVMNHRGNIGALRMLDGSGLEMLVSTDDDDN